MRKSRKEQGQFHTGPNIALRLAAILLMLVCLSVWLMNGLFAKYRTSDEGGDGARVISFGSLDLYEEGNFISGRAPLIPGVNLIKDVTVEFAGSESATYVFVKVDLPAHWMKGSDSNTFYALSNKISWEVADGWTFLETGTALQSPCVFYCKLPPNTTLKNKFIAGSSNDPDKGVIKVASTITKSELAEVANWEIPLQINLQAIVVQSNGFSSPSEAWASVDGKMD